MGNLRTTPIVTLAKDASIIGEVRGFYSNTTQITMSDGSVWLRSGYVSTDIGSVQKNLISGGAVGVAVAAYADPDKTIYQYMRIR